MSPFSLLFMVLMARRLPVLMGAAAAVVAAGVFFFLFPPFLKLEQRARTHTGTHTPSADPQTPASSQKE